jgi:lipoprotein NlpD
VHRALLLCTAAIFSGCAGMLSWDSGERGTRDVGLQGKRPPPEQPAARAPERKVEAPRDFPVAEAPAPVGADQYRVQAGDTLYSIAFRNSLDFRELAGWNGIGRDYRIVVGQVLNLVPPKAGSAPPPAPVVKPSAAEVPAPMPALPAGFEWTWPTRGTVTRGFAPAQGSKGIYIAGDLGQPVFAAAPGRVVYSGNALKGYGELIIIKHDEVHLTAYGYNRRRHVVEGDIVTSGQPIGELGAGPENKPLLHFELRAKGKPVDPVKYLPRPG